MITHNKLDCLSLAGLSQISLMYVGKVRCLPQSRAPETLDKPSILKLQPIIFMIRFASKAGAYPIKELHGDLF